MPHPCPPFNRRCVQAVDVQLLPHLFQHPQFDLAQLAVGRGDVAGQGIGRLVQAFGQAVADQAEQGGEAVLLFEKVEHGLGDDADAVAVVGGENRHVVDHALDGDQFGGPHLFIGCGNGDHHGQQGILGRQRGEGIGHGGSYVAAQNRAVCVWFESEFDPRVVDFRCRFLRRDANRFIDHGGAGQ